MGSVTLWTGEAVPVGKVVALGRNYADHAKEMGGPVPTRPMIFLKPATSVVGDGAEVEYPALSKNVHYELELGVVIGKTARRVKAADWKEYVLGYATLLDMTARDLQKEAMAAGDAWDLSKGFDTFCPIGPVADAAKVPDPHALGLELKVNGQVKQKGNTKDLIFKLPELIEYITAAMTLERGDVIATGTPEGVGPVQVGDTIEAALTGLPPIKVRMVAPPA